MHPPDNPSDPRATVVHSTGGESALPEIAGYRVARKLGQGGMATVYLATQLTLDRPVSIKVMEHGALFDETSMQRFENEARTIARLSHPNIVAIHEIGRTTDGRMYYSMPYLSNGDLAQRDLDRDDARIVDVLRALLSALDYAHARGIVHRDVKQENVLFDADHRPLLADFGIAMSKHDDVRITTAGFAVGSAGYMAPEQARGDAVDGRADLYSVGVLAYELLTGELPFRSTDAFALALMHAQKDIPRLPPAKKHWQAFVDQAMAKDPAQRFANAKQMLDALERIGQRSGSRSSQQVRQANNGSGHRRSRTGWILALAGMVAIASGLYVFRDHLPGTNGAVQTVTAPPGASFATPAVSSATSSREMAASTSSPQPPQSANRSSTPPTSSGNADTAKTLSKPMPAEAAASPRASSPVPVGQSETLASPASIPLPGDASARAQPPMAHDATATSIEPDFVKLHGRIGIWPPAAIARTEVTRQQYAAFVAATQRPPSPCYGADLMPPQGVQDNENSSGGRFGTRSPGRHGNHFGWNRPAQTNHPSVPAAMPSGWVHPGFRQSGDDPVVCVNWNDATAYTHWLSLQSGKRYRLPSTAEWRMAVANGTGATTASGGTVAAASGSPNPLGLYGLDGNVAEWLADCGLGCGRHRVAGRSWRGRGNDEFINGRETDRGFDDLGFRIVKVLPDAGSQAKP